MSTNEYNIWNTAIGCYFFRPEYAGETVFLSIEKDILLLIAESANPPMSFDSPEQAEQDLVTAVRAELQRKGWAVGKLSENIKNYPCFLAQLAVQVLAVTNMRDDEHWSDNAYWPRLWEMLDPNCQQAMPLNLTGEAYLALWHGLEHWANDLLRGELGFIRLPVDRPRSGRYIRLPKSQALLRQADLGTLPAFFSYAGLRPGEDDPEYIKEQISTYKDHFHRHAQRVLDDPDKIDAACEQIVRILRHWDGNSGIIAGSKHHSGREGAKEGGALRFWLRLRDGPQVSSLIGGLAEQSVNLIRTVMQRVSLAELLSQLCRQDEIIDPEHGYVYRPIWRNQWMTVYDEFSERWIEKRHAWPGDDLILLVPAVDHTKWCNGLHQVADSVQWFRSSSDKQSEEVLALAGLPAGWCAVHFTVKEKPILDRWTAGPWYDIIRFNRQVLEPVGGLRLHRSVWMVGAGPCIRINLQELVHELRLDRESYQIEDNCLTPIQAPALNNLGIHIVALRGHKPLRIEVQQPELSGACATLPSDWSWMHQSWPRLVLKSHDNLTANEGRLSGPVIIGKWPAVTKTATNIRRQAVELILQLRGAKASWLQPTIEESNHPLVRTLLKAAKQTRH